MNAKTRYTDPLRQLRSLVRIHLKKSGQTPAAFARAAGVHRSRFHHFFVDREDIGMSIFVRLCRYLKLDLDFSERFHEKSYLDQIVLALRESIKVILEKQFPVDESDSWAYGVQDLHAVVDSEIDALIELAIPTIPKDFNLLWDEHHEEFDRAYREVDGGDCVEDECEQRAIYIYLEQNIYEWVEEDLGDIHERWAEEYGDDE